MLVHTYLYDKCQSSFWVFLKEDFCYFRLLRIHFFLILVSAIQFSFGKPCPGALAFKSCSSTQAGFTTKLQGWVHDSGIDNQDIPSLCHKWLPQELACDSHQAVKNQHFCCIYWERGHFTSVGKLRTQNTASHRKSLLGIKSTQRK